MIFNILVVSIIVIFALIAMIDSLVLKNKYKLGEKFKEGFESMGPVALAIIGIIVIVPVVANVLTPIFEFLFSGIGADPSMGPTIFIANDMGGYQLALEICKNAEIGKLSGLVYGSMMGATVVFSIPVALSIIKKESVDAFSKGVLYGIVGIPFGTFIGGLLLKINILTLLINLIPAILVSVVLIIVLLIAPNKTIKCFIVFSKAILALSYFGLAVGLINDFIIVNLDAAGYIDSTKVIFFNQLSSVYDGVAVAGAIGLILCGALPLVYVLNKVLKKPLVKIGEKLGMSEVGITGFITSSANNIAMFSTLDEMKQREKILNVAWSVGAAFLIGDHLAFTAANDASMIGVVFISKLTAGFIGLLVAILFTKNIKEENSEGMTNE